MSNEFPPGHNPKAEAAARKAYAKAQRSFYKKKRVLIPAAFLALSAAVTACSVPADTADTDTADTSATETKAPAATEPTKAPAKAAEPAIVVSAKELIAVLEENALKAKNTYKGKRVTVSGVVGNIDASGKYFSLDPEPDAFIITGVQVDISKEFQDQVANFSKNQEITVTGKIDDVGEFIGYRLKAETIK